MILVCATSNKAVQGLLGRFLSEMQGLKGREPFVAKAALAAVEHQLPHIEPLWKFTGDMPPDLCAWDVFVHRPVQVALARLSGMAARLPQLGGPRSVRPAFSALLDNLSARSTTLKSFLQPLMADLQRGVRLQGLVEQAQLQLERLSAKQLDQVEDEILATADVIFCTLTTAGRPRLLQKLKRRRIMYALMDEAAQCVEAETLLILPYLPQRLLLVGDQQQLSATVISQGGVERRWDRSLMQRLFSIGHSWPMLQEQYRMAPEISRFPS